MGEVTGARDGGVGMREGERASETVKKREREMEKERKSETQRGRGREGELQREGGRWVGGGG